MLALALSACGGSSQVSQEPSVASSTGPPAAVNPTASPSEGHGSHESGSAVQAYLALCDMVGQVAAGDLDRAEATFDDEIHEAVHELAGELETTDREASAALLVAKAKVEADLEQQPPDASALDPDVRALQRAMAAALEAAGTPPPACPAEASG